MAAQALILDLDGTLWDSAPWFAGGLETDPKAVDQLSATLRSKGNIVREIQRVGITRSRLLKTAQARSGPPPLFPGMHSALEDILSRGAQLAVATSLPGSLAVPMLELAGLNRLFVSVIHAGLCRVPKPNPTSIQLALAQLRLDPEEAVYVGDRWVDAQAAKRAGMRMAWVTHGYENPVNADHVVVIGAEGIPSL